MDMEDYDDWAERGLCHRRLGRLEDALACYEKAVELNPCDTVTHCDAIRDEKALEELLGELAPAALSAALAELTPDRLRDAAHREKLAARLRRSEASPRAATVHSVLVWALIQDDNALLALAKQAGSKLPAALLRRFLSEFKAALRKS